MKEHRFILQPYKGTKTRYRCPICDNRQKTFTRYIDTETGKYLSDEVGICSRESNCGYHYPPKQYFLDHPNGEEMLTNANISPARARAREDNMPKMQKTSIIPYQYLRLTLKEYDSNCFIAFLSRLFDEETTKTLISTYYIGTCKYWPGGTVFWQIDINGNVRSGKMMLYNPDTGKRVKEPRNHINWVHKMTRQDKTQIFPDFNLKQCFFGEHLLQADKSKPVAIVESEKTAIIACAYLPKFIWLTCGSLNGISIEKLQILTGREVILYPDLRGYQHWSEIAQSLPNVRISSFLEKRASEEERKQGLDLADYLLKFNLDEFHQANKEQTPTNTKSTLTKLDIFQGLKSQEGIDNAAITPINPKIPHAYSQPFMGKSGKLYVQQPDALDRYAVYSSAYCYNQRSEKPEYVSVIIAQQDYSKTLSIDFSSLMIK